MIVTKKNGKLMVSPTRQSDVLFEVGRTFRLGRLIPRIDIRTFVKVDTSNVMVTIHVLSGIETSMMNSEPTDGGYFMASNISVSEPMVVVYRKPVIAALVVREDSVINSHLLNMNGYVLSGSNIYDGGSQDGALCLGGSVDPFSPSIVDMLLVNNANRDLHWRGDSLKGAFETSNDNEKYFEIESWPVTHHRQKLNTVSLLEKLNAS